MPYNPGIVNRSGEYFASGLARGLDSISRGLEQRQANIERIKQEDKLAARETKRMRSIAKQMQEELGLSDAQIENANVDELGGAVEGLFSSRKIERDTRAAQVMDAQLADHQYQQDQRSRMGVFNERLGAMPGYPDSATAAKMMAMEGVDMDNQSRMMQGMAAMHRGLAGQASNEPKVITKDGVKLAYSPETGQFNVLEEPMDMTAKPIPGAPGYLQIGRTVVKKTGGADDMDPTVLAGKQRALAEMESQVAQLEDFAAKGQKSARVDDEGNVWPAAIFANDEPIEALLTQRKAKIKAMQKELGAGPAEESVVGDKDKKQFKVGQAAYQNGMKYQWDGQKWVAVGVDDR